MGIQLTDQQKKRLRAALIVGGLLLLPGTAITIQQKILESKLPKKMDVKGFLSGQNIQPGTVQDDGKPAKDGYTKLTFDTLRSWTWVDGKTPIPADIQSLDGKKIEMLGFMMPLTEVKNIKEFLLVPSLYGCCYGQPPAPNHMIAIKMPPGKTTKFFSDVIRIRGEFKVGETRQDGYLVSLYVLTPTDEIEKP